MKDMPKLGHYYDLEDSVFSDQGPMGMKCTAVDDDRCKMQNVIYTRWYTRSAWEKVVLLETNPPWYVRLWRTLFPLREGDRR